MGREQEGTGAQGVDGVRLRTSILVTCDVSRPSTGWLKLVASRNMCWWRVAVAEEGGPQPTCVHVAVGGEGDRGGGEGEWIGVCVCRGRRRGRMQDVGSKR